MISKEQILDIAARKDFIVDRYAYRHDKVRRLCRRMAKDGELVLISQDKQGFTYRTEAQS